MSALLLALAGLQFATSPAAQAVKPAGSRVELLHGSADPSAAETQSTNLGNWIGRNLYLASGTTQEDLGCAATDTLAEAVVATTADGSAERPAVPDDHTGISSLFTWTLPGNATAIGQSSVAVSGAAINGLQAIGYLYTHDGWVASPQVRTANVNMLWPTGTALSLVLVCVDPIPDPATKEFLVRRGADGHAITSWVNFLTLANPSNPAQTSAGWQIVSPKTVPSVGLTASFAETGTSGTATVTLTGTDRATLTGATGSVSLYAGEETTGTPVATATVTDGVASLPLTGLTPGSRVDYTAVYTPDEAGAATYATATSDTTTFTVTRPAAATTTTIEVTGPLTEGAAQTLTATIVPAAAGTVTFKDGSATLGTAPVTVASGTAVLTRALTVGAHSLTASFAPTDTTAYAASVSTARSITIAAKPAATVTVASASGTYGRATTATVTVKAGTAAADGTVMLTLDGAPLGTAAVTGGTATVTLPATTAAGSHTLAASYPGSATAAAGSGSGTVAIAQAATRATVALKPKKITRKQATKGKVKATVAVIVPGATVHAAGTVTVTVGAKRVSARLTANGTVTVKLPKVKKAPKKLIVAVTYAGDGNLAGTTARTTVKVKH